MKPSTLDGQTWLLSPNCSSLETGLYPNHANHQNGYLVSSVLSSSPSTLSPRSVSSCASLASGSPSIITATVPVTKSETLKSISKPKFIRSSSLSASPSFGESNSFNHHAHHRQFSNNQDCIVTHSLPSFCWCKKDCQTLTGGGYCELESTSSCNLNSGWKNNFNCITTTRDIKNKTFCEKQQSANTTTATIATSIQSFSYVNVNHNNDVNSDSDQFFPQISPTLPSHDFISTGVDSTFISSDCPILPSGSTLCLLFCETTSDTKTRDNYYIKKQQNQENINNNRCHNINFVSAQENQCLPWHRSSCFFSSSSTLTAEEAATANESSSPCCDANFNHSNYKQANHDGDKDDCVDEDDDEDRDEKKKKGDGFDESSCKRRAESKKSCDVDSVFICSDNVDDNEYYFNRGIKVNSKSNFNNYLKNGRCLSYPGLNSCVSCDNSKNPNITSTCNDHLDDISSLIKCSSSRICKSWPTLAASLLNVNQLENHQQPSNSINNQCDIFSKDDLQHSWIELCKTLESISSELKHFQDKLEDSNYNLSDLSDLWSTLSSIDQFKHQRENNNNNYHNHNNLTKVNNYINNNHINSFLDEVNWTFFESEEDVTKLQSSVETINSVANCTSCSDEVMNFTINGQDRKRDTKFGKPPINHHSSASSLVNKCKINLVRGEKANTKDESNVPRPVLHPVQIDCKHNKELSQQQLLTKSNQHNDQHHQQRDTVYVKPRRRDISRAKRDLKQLSESSNANNGLNSTDQAELERIRLLLSNLDSTKYRTRSGSRSRASSVSDSNRSSLNTNPPSTTLSTVSSQSNHKLKTVRQLSDLTNSDVNPAFPPIPLLTNVEVQSTPFGTIRKFRRSLSAAPLLITKETSKVSSPSLPPTAPSFPRRSGHPKLRELTNRNLFSKSCDVDSNHNSSLNNTVTAHDNHNNHSNSNSVRSNRFGFNTKTVSGLVEKQKLTAGTVNDNYDEEKQKRKEINVDALVVAAAAQDDDDDKCIVDGVKTTIRAKSVDRVVLLKENKRKDSRRNKNSIGRGSLMMMASPSPSSPTSRSSSPSTVNSATVPSSMESSQVDELAIDKCASKLDSTLIRSLSTSSSNTKQGENQIKSKMDLRRSTSLIIMPNRLDPVVEEETSNDGNNNVNDNTDTQHGGIAKLQPPAKKGPSKENQCSTLPRRNCHQTSDSIKYNQLKDRLKPSWIKGKSDKIKDQQVKPITSIPPPPPPPPPLPPSTVPASIQRQLDFDDGTTPSDSESLSAASETLPSLGSCLNLGEPSGSGSVVYRRAPKLSCTSPFRQNQSIDLGELRSHRLSHSSLDELPPPYSSSSSLTPKVDTEEREALEAENLLEYNDNNNNNSNNSNVDEGANCQLKGKTGDNSCHVNDSRITILPEKRFRRKGHILMGDQHQHPMSVQNVITREQKGTQAITGQTYSPSRKSSLPEGRVSCSSESLLESEEIEDQRPQQIDYSEDDDGSALKDQMTEAQRSSSDQEQQGEQKNEQHRDRDYRPSVHRRTVSAVLPLGQIDDDNDSTDRELIERNASGGGSDSFKDEGSSINYLSSNQSPIREKYRNIERHHSDTTGRLGNESVNIVDLIRSAKASVGSNDFKEDSSSKLDANLMSTSATASTVGGSTSDINSRRLSSSTKRASSSTSQLNVSSSIGSLAGGSGSSGAGQYSNSSLDYSESSTLTYPGGLLMGSRGSPLGQTLGGSSAGPPSTPSTPSISGSSSLTRPRYTKKPLRGPYGEMLEKEIRKSSMSEKQRSLYADLAFLNDLIEANKRRSKDSTSDFGGSNFKGSDSEISSERKSGLSNCSSLDDSTKRTSDIMVSEISDFETNPSPGRVSTPSIDVSDSPHHHISTQSAHSQNNLTTPQSQLKHKQQQHQPHTHPKPSRKQAISSSPSPSIATGDTSSVKYRDPLMSQLPEAEEESLINQISSEPESTGRWNKSNHKSSSDPFRRSIFAKRHTDTRTHVVGELYDTEKSYVESLQILVNKYMKPLKSAEYSNLVDSTQVDHIFYQIPEILKHHEAFLETLKQRLTSWDSKQKVGDVFVEAFTKQPIIDTYTAFINNWKIAKDTIKTAIQAKQAFARYLENMSREHKGKLTLDAILIMPVQRIPRYELLIKELIKHTNVDHPDHQLLLRAQKEVHELALKINRMEREAFEQEQMAQKIKDIEHFIEGGVDLSSPDRTFIRYDFVTIPGALGTKKERCLFLFSDLLVITSIKKKSSATRKFSTSSSGTSPLSTLEGNKYKYLTRFPLESVDTAKGGDGNLRKTIKEIDSLREDAGILNQINELMNNLNCGHQAMEEAVRALHSEVNRQLVEKQTNDSQLLSIELQVTSPEVVENLVIIFPSTEKRAAWEESFEAAKTKFAITNNQKPPPEFLSSLPIRKTRAGLQFTCASPTLYRNQYNLKDIWICNSDGYVGQVCVLTLHPTPTVASCNGVCNSQILCVSSIPAATINNNCYPVSLRRSYVSEEPLFSENSGLEGTETEATTNCSILTSTCSTPSLSNLSSASIQSSPPASSNSFLVISARPESMGASTSPSRSLTPTPSTKSKQSTSVHNSPNPHTHHHHHHHHHHHLHQQQTGHSSSSQFQLDSESSDEESESSLIEETDLMRLTSETSHSPVDSCHSIDSETNQPTMWLGTKDGCIYIYNCNDNIRIRKNKLKIQLQAAVHCIIYMEKNVYSGLSNGQIVVFQRDSNGTWSTADYKLFTIDSGPIHKLLQVAGKLWCSAANQIKVIATSTMEVEKSFQVNSDPEKIVLGMVNSGLGVWVSSQGSSIIKLYHGTSYECLLEIDVAPAVTRMLATCDEIIRQHKAACLRVTALLACKDLLWIGTSAGIIMTLPLPHLTPSTTSIDHCPNISGIPHGHTGHVRFLTTVDVPSSQLPSSSSASSHHNHHYDLFHSNTKSYSHSKRSSSQPNTNSSSKASKILVISGGDGYEDFSNFGHNDSVGRDDSTNHLLLWHV